MDFETRQQQLFALRELLTELPVEGARMLFEAGHLQADIERLDYLDPLTGLPNRYWLEQRVRQARRAQEYGTVALVDLDHFKIVNDRLGHAAGDQLLIRFGDELRASLPKACEICRVGGDEFVIWMKGISASDAKHLLEVANTRFGESLLVADLQGLTASFSAGVTPFRGISTDEVLKACDVALYAAKNAGRGTVTVFEEDHRDIVTRRRELAAAVLVLQQQLRVAQLEGRTDALTGLYNRRALDEILDAERAPEAVTSSGAMVAFIDIDHFGEVNHRYGDHAGDDILRQVAEGIRSSLRPDDLLFRKGGEEFIAVLLDHAGEDASAWGERIRLAIEYLGIPHASSSTAPVITVTVGVAAGGSSHTVRKLMYAAGEQVMAAKRLGQRNRVHVASPPI